MAEPKVGDLYIQHGGVHEIVEFRDRAVLRDGEATKVKMFRFVSVDNTVTVGRGEVPRFRGIGMVDDLKWSEQDGAWYMEGRVLSRDERTAVAALTGTWPPAAGHIALRSMLDAHGKTHEDGLVGAIDLKRMTDMIRARRHDKVARKDGESEKDHLERCEQYAARALEHCEELRLKREEA